MGKSNKVSAGCLVVASINDSMKVLLVHPANNGKPRKWGIPQGIVKDGESLDQAAIRETYEETGLLCVPSSYIGKVKYQNGKTVHCFATLPLYGHISLNLSWEIDEAVFMDLAEASEKMPAPAGGS